MALPRNAHHTHSLLIFLVNLCLLLGLPSSFLPSQPLLLISISWNLGLKLYNSAANTKSCRKKKNTKKFNKKKYINKKVPKGGDSHLLWGAMASNSTFLSHPVGWKKKEAPLGSHNKFWGSFTKVPKTGQRSEISRQLSQAALEGRGP